MAINSSGQAIFGLTHIEEITVGAGEDVDEVAGGASGMGVDRIGYVRLVTGLVKDRLLGCMGQVLQWVSGRERSHWWDEGHGGQG